MRSIKVISVAVGALLFALVPNFTGPSPGSVHVRIAQDPADPSLVRISADTNISTQTPECGGPTSGTEIVCNDSLMRSITAETFGGADTIEIIGTRITRVLSGGGDDQVISGSGADSISGGPGSDSISSGLETDTVVGGTGDDSLFGAGGGDELKGGAGSDSINAGGGGDLVRVRDRVKDFTVCGSGNDTAIADNKDRFTRGCETVNR
jgi:hemolysin type calcium-binding protein